MKRAFLALSMQLLFQMSIYGEFNSCEAFDKLGNSLVMQAINSDNEIEAKNLIVAGHTREYRNHLGQTALMLAALKGYDDIFVDLIQLRFNCNAEDRSGKSVIDYIIAPTSFLPIKKNSAILRALFNAGVWVHKDCDEWTPLMRASFNGNRGEVEKILQEKKAEINIATSNGETALLCAIEQGHIKIVEMLLDNGAHITECDYSGYNELVYAVYYENPLIIDLLLKSLSTSNNKVDLCPVGVGYMNALSLENAIILALFEKYFPQLKENRFIILFAALVAEDFNYFKNMSKCDINDLSDFLETILLFGIVNENEAMMNFAFDNRLAPSDNKVAQRDNELIEVAIKSGNLKIVQILINHGANINFSTKNGESALSLAMETGHQNMIEFFSKMTSDDVFINELTCKKILDAAFVVNNVEVVKRVFKNNPDASKLLNQSILNFAFFNDQPDIVELCLKHGVSNYYGNLPIIFAVRYDAYQCVKFLLEKDHDCYVRGQSGATPLEIASARNNLSIVKLFLEHGMDPNYKNKEGRTACNIAYDCGHTDVIELLKKYGGRLSADVSTGGNRKSNNEEKVSLNQDELDKELLAVVKARDTDRIKWLLQHGANSNVVGEHGETPLKCAAQLLEPSLVKILLSYRADPNQSIDEIAPLTCAMRPIYLPDPEENLSLYKKFDRVDYQEMRNQKAVIKLLLNAGANPNDARYEKYLFLYKNKFWANRASALSLLLKAGLVVDADDRQIEKSAKIAKLYFSHYPLSFDCDDLCLEDDEDF